MISNNSIYTQQNLFTPFKGLLNFLNDNYYQTPMDPHDCDPNDPGSYEDRLQSIKNFEMSYKDTPIFRRNHNLCHHLRSMYYVPAVIEYLEKCGDVIIKEQLIELKITHDDLIKKIMLAMAYSSICRNSEIDWSQEPQTHHYYRAQAGALFFSHYLLSKEPQFSIFNIFKDIKELHIFKDKLVAMGTPEDEDILHIIINICHKLDLYRCRDLAFAQETVDQYIRKYTDPNMKYGHYFNRLLDFASNCLMMTGYNRDANLEHIYFVNSNLDFAISTLTKVIPSDKREYKIITKSDYIKQLKKGFFVKFIAEKDHKGVYTNKNWEEFLLSITKTPINKDKPITREEKKLDHYFTVAPDGKSFIDARVKKIIPSKISRKYELSHLTAFTYFCPEKAFSLPRTVLYSLGSTKVGVIYLQETMIDNIKFISNQDIGSYYRSTSFDSPEMAMEGVKFFSTHLMKDINSLIKRGHKASYNEVYKRANNNIFGILIADDLLLSRLIAIFRSLDYAQRMKEMHNENSDDSNYILPLIHYTSCNSFKIITAEEQDEFIESARIVIEQNENNIERIIFETELYLEKLKNNQDDYSNYLNESEYNEIENATTQLNELLILKQIKLYYEKILELKAHKKPSFIQLNEIHALHIAAANGHLKKLKNISQTNINITDKRGKTMLIYAAENGQFEVVELLLKLLQDKLDIWHVDQNNRNFIEAAIFHRQIDFLLKVKLLPQIQDNFYKLIGGFTYLLRYLQIVPKFERPSLAVLLKKCTKITEMLQIFPYIDDHNKTDFINKSLKPNRTNFFIDEHFIHHLYLLILDLSDNQKHEFLNNQIVQCALNETEPFSPYRLLIFLNLNKECVYHVMNDNYRNFLKYVLMNRGVLSKLLNKFQDNEIDNLVNRLCKWLSVSSTSDVNILSNIIFETPIEYREKITKLVFQCLTKQLQPVYAIGICIRIFSEDPNQFFNYISPGEIQLNLQNKKLTLIDFISILNNYMEMSLNEEMRADFFKDDKIFNFLNYIFDENDFTHSAKTVLDKLFSNKDMVPLIIKFMGLRGLMTIFSNESDQNAFATKITKSKDSIKKIKSWLLGIEKNDPFLEQFIQKILGEKTYKLYFSYECSINNGFSYLSLRKYN